MKRLISVVCRIFLVAAFVLAGLAVWERLARLLGYTLLRGAYDPWRLLEYAVVALLFVVALQLREIKMELRAKGSA
jgi:hypothetical protein